MERPISKEVQIWLEAEERADKRHLARLKQLREEKFSSQVSTEKITTSPSEKSPD